MLAIHGLRLRYTFVSTTFTASSLINYLLPIGLINLGLIEEFMSQAQLSVQSHTGAWCKILEHYYYVKI